MANYLTPIYKLAILKALYFQFQEKAALEKAQRKFEEEKRQFERLQLQRQLQKQKERLLNENKAIVSILSPLMIQ